MRKNRLLLTAAWVNFVLAAGHIVIILAGPDAYRLAGAGEEMARMAAAGSVYPALVTGLIACLLFVASLYALSGAGVVKPLPMVQPVLAGITLVYCSRGIAGLLLLLASGHELPWTPAFILVSSSVCLVVGLVHLAGVWRGWGQFRPQSIIGSTLSGY